jgi:hypothetical protein
VAVNRVTIEVALWPLLLLAFLEVCGLALIYYGMSIMRDSIRHLKEIFEARDGGEPPC